METKALFLTIAGKESDQQADDGRGISIIFLKFEELNVRNGS